MKAVSYSAIRNAGSAMHALIAASCAAAMLLLAPAAHAADPPLLEVKRFVVEGENPLSESDTQSLLRPYLGPHESLNTLEAAATALQEAIRKKGYSFHRVIVPAQQPAAGDLTLRVLPFMLDQLTVTGNQHFSSENILRSLPGLKPGRAPNVGLLAQQLSLANEHPSKRLTLQVKEGTKPDAVDAEVRVADVAPSQFFVSVTGGSRDVDNTLNKNTGYARVTVGYQHSNLFNLDHTGTLAYTTSPEHPDRVTQVGAFYTVPFYGYHTMLTAYYTYSDVDSGSVGLGGQSFDVSGSGEFWGAKVTYLLPRIRDVVHNVSLGWDERYFKSNVSFLGAPLPSATVGSRPITFRYQARIEREQAALAGYIEYAHNLSGGRANGDFDYAAARPGADRDWNAYRFGLDGTYTLARWTLSAKYRGQYTTEPLIPGEQLGLSGASSVRGFREREVTGDKGHFVNLEAQAPPVFADLTPLVFYDFGHRSFVVPVIGQSMHDNISSAGAGLRWRWQRLDLNVTWAHVLNGVGGGTPRDHDKLHFSAFYRF
jgi:hemolysin activation/secretion protein